MHTYALKGYPIFNDNVNILQPLRKSANLFMLYPQCTWYIVDNADMVLANVLA
jgi:hypothetical protein